MTVTDSSGTQQPASGLYTSPTQLNAILPGTLATGPATFSVAPVTGSFTVTPAAPGIFSANASGSGVAAAETVVTHADGTVTGDSVFHLFSRGIVRAQAHHRRDTRRHCLPHPIRRRLAQSKFAPEYFGRHWDEDYYAGLRGCAGYIRGAGPDQCRHPPALAGAGVVNVAVSADNTTSNLVTIQIQ